MSIQHDIDERSRRRRREDKSISKSGNANFYAMSAYVISHVFPLALIYIIVAFLLVGWAVGSAETSPSPIDPVSINDEVTSAYRSFKVLALTILTIVSAGYILSTLGAFVMGVIGLISQPVHRGLGFAVVALTFPVIVGFLIAAYAYFSTL